MTLVKEIFKHESFLSTFIYIRMFMFMIFYFLLLPILLYMLLVMFIIEKVVPLYHDEYESIL